MSKATFYEHFANKEECILALFDARVGDAMLDARWPPPQRRGPRTYADRHRAGLRAILETIEAHPTTAQTLLVEIIGAGPRATERRDTMLDAIRRRSCTATPCAGGQAQRRPRVRLARRRVRDRRRDAELVSRQLRTGHPEQHARPAPLIERLHRSGCSPSRAREPPDASPSLERDVTACRRCPRLVAWREQVAREQARRVRRRGSTGAGRSRASATRRRGCWCSASRPPRTAPTAPAACSPATARATSSSRRCTAPASPTSRRRPTRDDGLALRGAWITAAVRCAPPANKPTPAERDTCLPWTAPSSRCCRDVRVVALPRRVRLGRRAAPARRAGAPIPSPARASATAPRCAAGERMPLLGCFHPSQQNTFTGRLTPAMLDDVLLRAGRGSPRLGAPGWSDRAAPGTFGGCRSPRSPPPSASGSTARSRSRRRSRSTPGRRSPAASTRSSPRRPAAARRSPRSSGASTGCRRAPEATRTRLVYVSPLKALSYDIERNLRAPLRGIGADVTVAIRTGDTPQRERAAMRRHPPGHPDHDARVAVPDAHLAGARDPRRGVEAVIVDEIHAVGGDQARRRTSR